jgi:hypothetical protein
MQTNQHYTQLLQDLKSRISRSRYIAAENLFLQIGKLHHNFDTTIQTIDGHVAAELFKDKYLLDFLQLKDDHTKVKLNIA